MIRPEFTTYLAANMRKHCATAAQWSLVCGFLTFPVAMGLANLAMLLTLVFALLAGQWQRQWQTVQKLPMVWAALGLYGLIVLGCFYTQAPHDDVVLHLNKYSKLLYFVIFLSLLTNEHWRQKCLHAYTVSMGFILLSSYANIWLDLPWSTTHNQGWGQDHTVVGDYITQNIMMSFFAVLAFHRALTAVTGWQRCIWWLTGGLAGVSIMHLSQGRTGYLLLGVAVLVFAWMSNRGMKRWLVLASMASVLTLIGFTSETVQQRVELAIHEASTSEQMEITSIGGRINFWKYSWKIVQERPLTGWGTGSYHSKWCETVQEPGWCSFGHWHPHNQYLFFWMEHGILGAGLFLGLMLSPLWVARGLPCREQRLLVCFVAIFAVNSLINASLWSSRENHFFIFMLALLSAQTAFAKTPLKRSHTGHSLQAVSQRR